MQYVSEMFICFVSQEIKSASWNHYVFFLNLIDKSIFAQTSG